MPQPAPVSDLSAQIRQVYAAADAALAEEQQTLADDPRLWRRRRTIVGLRQRVGALMDDADAQAHTWLSNEFPRTYGLGGTTGARAAGTAFAWTAPHLDAVTVLAQDLYDDLLKASGGVRRSTKALIGRLAKAQVSSVIVGGQTADQGGTVLADLLEHRGIWAVRYKDGSLNGIGSYAEMAIRTKSAVAYNEGTVRGSGVPFFECFDGPSCGFDNHDDPTLANGLILSAEEALANPISHPRCQRSWSPRPDLLSAEDAARAKPTTTPEQRADAAAAEQERLAAQQARRARKAHADVLARRQERIAKGA